VKQPDTPRINPHHTQKGTAMPDTPATRQSIFEQMSCETAYKLVHIDGLRTPNTTQSDRGTDIHEVLAQYVDHCASKRIPADFAFLDSLTDSATEEVAQILESCRENLTVDWQNLFGSEISMGLDKDFQPTYSMDHDNKPVPIDQIWGTEVVPFGGKPPAYCGILDTIYLMPGGTVARIVDWKSHPRPFPADSFQGKLYSLMLMMHIPELTEVEFGLKFVRYANVVTTQKYFRSDVPQMMDDVRRVRNRQRDIHEKVENQQPLRTHGGAHCIYCPCVLDPVYIPCPIYRMNPMTNLSPADRLNWRLVHDAMNRTNNQAMSQYVDGSGQEIHSQDANGKHYTFGPKPKKKTTYPLFTQAQDGSFDMPIVDALLNWANDHPDDLVPRKGRNPWFCNLSIGATKLKGYLNHKDGGPIQKRVVLHQCIKDLAVVEEKIELGITRDASVDDGQGEEHKEWDASGSEEIEF
jgi:hypothetical protein